MTNQIIAARVAKGVALLDERRCGWWDEDSGTDLDQLDMGNCLLCVLGQEYGNYEDGWERLADLSDSDWAFEHGFDVSEDTPLNEYASAYAALTAEWRRVITARRAEVQS